MHVESLWLLYEDLQAQAKMVTFSLGVTSAEIFAFARWFQKTVKQKLCKIRETCQIHICASICSRKLEENDLLNVSLEWEKFSECTWSSYKYHTLSADSTEVVKGP